MRPLSLGDVLDGMFRMAIAHWRAFTIAVGAVVLPLSLLSGLALTRAMGTMPGFVELVEDPELQTTIAQGTIEPGDLVGMAAAGLLSLVASLIFTPLIYGIAVHVAAVGYRDGSVEPMDSIRAAGRRYLALLGTVILIWLVPLLILLLPVVLMIIGGIAGVDALIVIGGLGVLVSAVFAVIATIRLSLSVATLMIEGVGPVEAVRRSNELVRGRTGWTFGVLLVAWIIVLIIGSVLSLPFQLGTLALGGVVGAIVVTIGSTLSSLVQNVLIGVALVLVYFDRRVRTEGYDLTQLAGELGNRRDQAW